MADRRVLDLIKSRRSIPKFTPAVVPREVVEQMLDAATWAPNHHLTEPWQFFVLEGAVKERFAQIRRAFRLTLFANPEAPEALRAAEKIARDTRETPLIIVVTTRVSSDPALTEDDYAAAMMAVGNILLAATAHGVGTYLRTGGLIHDPVLRTFLRLPDDRRVTGIVYAGHPALIPKRSRTPWQEKTVWLITAEEPIPAAARADLPAAGAGIAIDPVCDMEVEIATAPATSVYKGRTYYFCAPGCKKIFDEHPDEYA